MSAPPYESRHYIYPHPFPGYAGAFAYAGREDLGSGMSVWGLEILPGTAHLREFPPGDPRADASYEFRCKMKKQLLSLPEDACASLRDQKGRYVVEAWRGEASKGEKAIALQCVYAAPPEGTWSFGYPGMPLSRSDLGGEYQFVMERDDLAIRAAHKSWAESAGRAAGDACGHMVRFGSASRLCHLLMSDEEEQLMKSLEAASQLLRRIQTQAESDPRRIYYEASVDRAGSFDTVGKSFKADVAVVVRYKASRSDVISYFGSLAGGALSSWAPRWQPPEFRVLNGVDANSVEVRRGACRLVRGDGGPGRPRYTGKYHQGLDLANFPFDNQWFHCCFEAEHAADVELVPDICEEGEHSFLEDARRRLQKQWTSDAWRLRAVGLRGLRGVSREKDQLLQDTAAEQGSEARFLTRVNVGVKVRRRRLGLLLRILLVLFLIEGVSLLAFMLDPVDGLATRLSVVLMMMLTGAGYSSVVHGLLPSLGYLTLLDWYIIGSYLFFTSVALQVSILGMIGRDMLHNDEPHTALGRALDKVGWFGDWEEARAEHTHIIHDWDSYLLRFDFVVLLAAHLALVVAYQVRIARREDGKPMDEPFGEHGGPEDADSGWCFAADGSSRKPGSESDSDEYDASRPLMSRRSH